MTEGIRYAGTFETNRVSLRSLVSGRELPIHNVIGLVTITESMYNTYISGTITITESGSIIKSLPITGKELLFFDTTDYYQNERQEVFFVYAMSNYRVLSNADNSLVEYTLHFCSREKFICDTNRVQKAYSGLVHNQAASLYREYIYNFYDLAPEIGVEKPFKNLVTWPTDNTSVYVIPNMRPDEALQFLSRRAFTTAPTSQHYMFWEARDEYFMMPTNGLYEYTETNGGAQEFYSRIEISNESLDQDDLQSTIISMNIPSSFNTIDALKNGGAVSKTTEVDILNKATIVTTYNHIENTTQVDDFNSLPVTENGNERGAPASYTRHNLEFVNRWFANSINNLVIKDYLSPGFDTSDPTSIVSNRHTQHYGELMTKNLTRDYNLRDNAISVVVRGGDIQTASKIKAGGVIYLNIPEITSPFQGDGTPDEDSYYSGFYIILSATHKYENATYVVDLLCSRGGIGVDPFTTLPQLPSTEETDPDANTTTTDTADNT